MAQENFNFFQLLSKLFKMFLHGIQNGLAIKIALIGCKKKQGFVNIRSKQKVIKRKRNDFEFFF